MGIYRIMKYGSPCIILAAGIFLSPPAAQAELPGLKKQPWLGYFIGMEAKRKFRFGVTAKGLGVLSPLKSDGEPVYMNDPIQINFEVLETTPEGKSVRKTFQPDSLASDQEASEDPEEPVTFRGKVTGGAAFEITVTPERGGFSVSGRLTDKGTTTNPLRFEVSADFTPYVSKPGDEKDEIKRFEKRAKKDVLRYETASRKRDKLEFLEEANPATAIPEALSSAQIETDGYGGIEITLQASEKSKLTFDDKGSRPLWKGFTLRWKADEGVDTATQKLTFTAR
jgi:hypothetical protein